MRKRAGDSKDDKNETRERYSGNQSGSGSKTEEVEEFQCSEVLCMPSFLFAMVVMIVIVWFYVRFGRNPNYEPLIDILDEF